MKPKSKYTKEQIQILLMSNDKAVYRAIVAIYRRQTPNEQSIGVTVEHNGEGFTAIDSMLFSSFAQQILAGRTLSYKQLQLARAGMKKYWAQLIKVAEANDVIRAAQQPKQLELA